MSTTNIGSIVENAELIPPNETIVKEIVELTECCSLERKKYNEYCIIKEIALKCATEESGLPTELQSKLHDILMASEVQQCLELTHNNTVLGLSLDTIELTFNEKSQIKQAVQQGISNKSCKLFNELEELGIKFEEGKVPHSISSLSVEDKILVDYKKQLNEKQELYILYLEELISILKQIVELKSKTLPESTNKKINDCDLKLRLFELQSQVMETKLRVDVFTETSCSADAYCKLLKDILQQQTECKQEIEQLQVLREKYKQVASKQYNEILQSYVKYKAIVENQKSLLNRLEKNNF